MIETHLFDLDGRPLESSGESAVKNPDMTKLNKEAEAAPEVILKDKDFQQVAVTGDEALLEGLKPGDTQPMPVV